MRSSWTLKKTILLAGLALASFGPAAAGTMTVQWDAVSDSDLAGYHVYYGPSAGSHAQMVDAGKATTVTLNVNDCTITYVSVRSYDSAGLESATDSNAVRGFARPVISSLSATSIKQGETKTITVTGSNFDAGVAGDATRPATARIKLSGTGLTVTGTTINSCNQATMTVQAATSAPAGAQTVSVENPDITYTDPQNRSWVFGQLANALTVTSTTTDTTRPTVSSVSPAAGATNVATTVKPTVTFSESLSAASVTSSTVRLIDANGVTVAATPTLSGNVVTLSPSAALAAGKGYRVTVSTGVKDVAGNALATTYTQASAFTTATSTGTGTAISVTGAAPSAGQYNVPTSTTAVKIYLNTDVSGLWTKLTRAQLQATFVVTRYGIAATQVSTSPTVTDGGKTVVITLSGSRATSATYQTRIRALSSTLVSQIQAAGINPGVLSTGWIESPGWTTTRTVTSPTPATALARTAAGTTSTAPATTTTLSVADGSTAATPATNTNVATNSEFVVDFGTQQVAPKTAQKGTFRIIAPDGTEVPQASAPRLENGNTAVVITPAQALEAGRTYRIVVRVGGAGLGFVNTDGTLAAGAEAQTLVIPFATKVSGKSQNSSLAVAP